MLLQSVYSTTHGFDRPVYSKVQQTQVEQTVEVGVGVGVDVGVNV